MFVGIFDEAAENVYGNCRKGLSREAEVPATSGREEGSETATAQGPGGGQSPPL